MPNIVSEFGAVSAAVAAASDMKPAAIVKIAGSRRARVITGVIASATFQGAGAGAVVGPYIARLVVGHGDISEGVTSLLYAGNGDLGASDRNIKKVVVDTPVELGKSFPLFYPDSQHGLFVPASVALFAVIGAVQTALGEDPVKAANFRIALYGYDIETPDKIAGLTVR